MPLFASYRDFQRLEFKVDAIAKAIGVVIRHEDFLIHMEQQQMTTAAEIKAQSETLLAEVRQESDRIVAIQTLVQGQNDTINSLNQQLRDAIANGADKDTLQAISDNIAAATAAVDANLAAEAAVANTEPPAPPAPEPAPAPAPAPSAAPVITNISTASGAAAGGDTVTLNGSGFTGVTAVTFGGVAAPSVTPDHDTVLTVVTPPGSGTVDVVVSSPAGDSAPISFTYA